jgi:HSP90 family molecular chaperone
MADEQIIKLLEEIRDLQKQNVENYKTAWQNQQQSIKMQRKAIARQKGIAVAVFVVLALGLAAVYFTTAVTR